VRARPATTPASAAGHRSCMGRSDLIPFKGLNASTKPCGPPLSAGCCGERAARYWFRLIRGSPEADSSECLNASERTRLDATPGGGGPSLRRCYPTVALPVGSQVGPSPGSAAAARLLPSTLSSPPGRAYNPAGGKPPPAGRAPWLPAQPSARKTGAVGAGKARRQPGRMAFSYCQRLACATDGAEV
jgi:hypothetical protein